MYSVEGLTHGIERCKINIETLKQAIKAEQQTIADYKNMIDTLERVEQEKEEANSHVEVVHGN